MALKYIDANYVFDITSSSINTNIIEAAEKIVEDWARGIWEETTVTDERHSGNGSEWITVLNTPVTEFVSAEIYDEDNVLETSVAASDVTEMRRNIGMIKYEDGWDQGEDNILITYKWATDTTVPLNVKIAIANVAAYLCANPIAAKSESLSSLSITHGTIEDILRIVPRRHLT